MIQFKISDSNNVYESDSNILLKLCLKTGPASTHPSSLFMISPANDWSCVASTKHTYSTAYARTHDALHDFLGYLRAWSNPRRLDAPTCPFFEVLPGDGLLA